MQRQTSTKVRMSFISNDYQYLTGLKFYTICLTINSSLHTIDGQNKHPIIICLDRIRRIVFRMKYVNYLRCHGVVKEGRCLYDKACRYLNDASDTIQLWKQYTVNRETFLELFQIIKKLYGIKDFDAGNLILT